MKSMMQICAPNPKREMEWIAKYISSSQERRNKQKEQERSKENKQQGGLFRPKCIHSCV